MSSRAMVIFAQWQNFYVVVGSSAGALIGLQFVVLSLLTSVRKARTDAQAGRAFATPAVVHFATVLGLSAILCAPWEDVAIPSVLWALMGATGLIYLVIIIRRIRAQTAYRPQVEDWFFHVVVPFAAYSILTASPATARFRLHETLFGLAGSALALLFSGIHNSWDAVTYHVFVNAPIPNSSSEGSE